MKKLTTLLLATVLFAGSSLHAQQTGRGAQGGTQGGENQFGWAIGLGGLAVIGVVAGVVASAASSSPSSFNH